MTKASLTKGEITSRNADAGQRVTKRMVDQGPPSVKAVSNLYAKNKFSYPDMAAKDASTPQFKQDQRRDVSDGDVPLKGERAGLRGGPSENGGSVNPTLDRGHYDITDKPQKPKGPPCTASGKDMTKSPFSRANKVYG
jgi:hypothetical protein